MKTKMQRFIEMSRKATPARVVTEILNDGWKSTGWNGRPATNKRQRRGMKRFAKTIRSMGLDSGSALWRVTMGGTVQPLPLP